MGGSTYEVTRSTTIEAPSAVVHDLIADFHEWPRWSPWEDLDPDLERTFSGAERGRAGWRSPVTNRSRWWSP
jgi:hypothetical protein